jgi:hypothetical protein
MNRPGIYQIGRVDDDGTTLTITGWGLGLCAAACWCHRHPSTGHLTIAENQAAGTLGLASHRPCDCCTPWTADELAAVLRDLADIGTLETA